MSRPSVCGPLSHSDTPQQVELLWAVISSSQTHLRDSTQQSHDTDLNAPFIFRTRNPHNPAAADQRLRPRGY